MSTFWQWCFQSPETVPVPLSEVSVIVDFTNQQVLLIGLQNWDLESGQVVMNQEQFSFGPCIIIHVVQAVPLQISDAQGFRGVNPLQIRHVQVTISNKSCPQSTTLTLPPLRVIGPEQCGLQMQPPHVERISLDRNSLVLKILFSGLPFVMGAIEPTWLRFLFQDLKDLRGIIGSNGRVEITVPNIPPEQIVSLQHGGQLAAVQVENQGCVTDPFLVLLPPAVVL